MTSDLEASNSWKGRHLWNRKSAWIQAVLIMAEREDDDWESAAIEQFASLKLKAPSTSDNA